MIVAIPGHSVLWPVNVAFSGHLLWSVVVAIPGDTLM